MVMECGRHKINAIIRVGILYVNENLLGSSPVVSYSPRSSLFKRVGLNPHTDTLRLVI